MSKCDTQKKLKVKHQNEIKPFQIKLPWLLEQLTWDRILKSDFKKYIKKKTKKNSGFELFPISVIRDL